MLVNIRNELILGVVGIAVIKLNESWFLFLDQVVRDTRCGNIRNLKYCEKNLLLFISYSLTVPLSTHHVLEMVT